MTGTNRVVQSTREALRDFELGDRVSDDDGVECWVAGIDYGALTMTLIPLKKERA